MQKLKSFFRKKRPEYDDYVSEEFPRLESKMPVNISDMMRQNARKISELEERCLSVIISNLERYIAAFKDPRNNAPSENRLFLERRFSETIFKRMKSNRTLKAEHLDLLINPHTKELDILDIDNSLIPAVVNVLQTHGKNILCFKGNRNDRDFKERLCERLVSSLPNVEVMDFDFIPSPRILRSIGKNCPFLKVLLFTSHYFNHNEDEYGSISFILKHCPHLEILQYDDTMGALCAMHKRDSLLRRKGLKNGVTDCKEYALTSLSSTMTGFPLREALKTCVTLCPKVTHLQILRVASDEEIETITGFSHLENVNIRLIYKVTTSCFNQFLKLRGSNIISLEIPFASCLSIVSLIDFCPNLQTLKLRNKGMNSFSESIGDLSFEGSLPHVKNLEFAYGDFNMQKAADILKLLLSAAKNVKKLGLQGSSGLSTELISSLDLFSIHELDVSESDIEADDCLKDLLLRGSLSTLNIEQCWNITNDAYFSLTKNLSEDKKRIVNIKWMPQNNFGILCIPMVPQYLRH